MILDTDALSDWAKRDRALLRKLPPADELLLPAIVYGEYRFGLLRSPRFPALDAWFEETIRTVSIADVTAVTAEFYARVRNLLERKGRVIPANDVWIAALTLQHGVSLLSRDKHFDNVDGLRRVSW